MTRAWEKRIEIRWRDLDSSGHVNNAVYVTYLEEVRTGWLANALGERAAASAFVLARVAIDYRRELSLDDGVVTASCRLRGIGNASIRTTEEIRLANGELAAEAEAVTVGWDPVARSSRPLTDAERAALAG